MDWWIGSRYHRSNFWTSNSVPCFYHSVWWNDWHCSVSSVTDVCLFCVRQQYGKGNSVVSPHGKLHNSRSYFSWCIKLFSGKSTFLELAGRGVYWWSSSHAWSAVWVCHKSESKNHSVVNTHCIPHHEALASRTFSGEMNDVLNMAIKVVNFINAGALKGRCFQLLCKDMECEHETLLFHTNVRWLSKGNMLGRLYELWEEIAIFLYSHQKTDLHDKFQSDSLQITLAYVVDIFEALNVVNLKLHGKNINIIMHHDTIWASWSNSTSGNVEFSREIV